MNSKERLGRFRLVLKPSLSSYVRNPNKCFGKIIIDLLFVWSRSAVLNSSPGVPLLCIFCMSLFVNTSDSDHQLVISELRAWTVFRLTCSLHSVHCSLLPEQGKSVEVFFTLGLPLRIIFICINRSNNLSINLNCYFTHNFFFFFYEILFLKQNECATWRARSKCPSHSPNKWNPRIIM